MEAQERMQSPHLSVQDRRRVVCRLGVDYQLAVARLLVAALNLDMMSILTLLAIIRANMREVARNPEAIRPYAGLDVVPPDQMRRPVSVYAIAKELRAAYETVRRHVTRLKDEGFCEISERGVIVPQRVLAQAAWMEVTEENWRAANRLVKEAEAFGVVARGPAIEAPADVRRHVARVSIEFFLKGLSLMAQGDRLDVMSVLVLRAIAFANIEHLAHDPEKGLAFAGLADIPQDRERRPVSVYAVAKSLLLPYETTRRTVLKLVNRGLVERRAEGGLVVPAAVMARPEAIAGFVEFAGLTEAFLDRLAAAGVTPTSGVV